MLHRADPPSLAQGLGGVGGTFPLSVRPGGDKGRGCRYCCRLWDALGVRCLGAQSRASSLDSAGAGAFGQPYCHPCRGADSGLSRSRRGAGHDVKHRAPCRVPRVGAGACAHRPAASLCYFRGFVSSLPRWSSPSPSLEAESPRPLASS